MPVRKELANVLGYINRNILDRLKVLLPPAIPCLLTITLIGIYLFGIWPRLTLAVVSILCLPLFFIELTFGFIEDNNKKKLTLFFASLLIGVVVTGLNFQSEYQTHGAIHLSTLSGWSRVWGILLTVAVISALIILIRLFRWSQEQWETVRELSQQHRLQKKNSWAQYISARNAHRLAIQQMKHEHQLQEEDEKQEALGQMQALKRQRRRTRFEFQSEQDNEKQEQKITIERNKTTILNGERNFEPRQSKRILDTVATVFRALIAVAFVVLSIAGFFLIPYSDQLMDGVSGWLESVEKLAEFLSASEQIFKTAQDALIYYLLFYISVVAIVGTLFYLFDLLIFQKSKRKEEDGAADLIEVYQTPASILLVAMATLFFFTNGNISLPSITEGWQFLLLIILLIILILTAIEIVRLVLVQCLEPNSLLKRLIYLIFVAALKLLSEILLGVITNLHIQSLISSFFALVFPDPDEATKAFNNLLNEKLNRLFRNATISVPDGSEKKSKSGKVLDPPEFEAFRRRRIWRRFKR